MAKLQTFHSPVDVHRVNAMCTQKMANFITIYCTRAISGRDLYCFKCLILLLFHVKNKTKARPFYENKQGAAYITEWPEMVRVRYDIKLIVIYKKILIPNAYIAF